MSADADPSPRFALLGHPASYDHFVRLMEATSKAGTGSRLQLYRRSFEKMLEWMPAYVSGHRIAFRADGETIHGRLIICPFLPERLSTAHDLKRAYEKVRQGCRLAGELGARVVALGGFTSIIVRGQAPPPDDLTLTTGASLTAAIAVAQLEAAAGALGRNLAREPVAVIGATGDVGRVAIQLLDASDRHLIIVARGRQELERLRLTFDKASVEVSTDVRAAIRSARAIIAATSAARPLLELDDLEPGTVLCDVGYPKTLATGMRGRNDVLAFDGGIARFPRPLGLQDYTELPGSDLIFGCFAEGMILAAQDQADSAAPRASTAARARELLTQARRLSVVPAPAVRRAGLAT